MMRRDTRERDESRSEMFRCPGCETPTRNGKMCGACHMEQDKYTGAWCAECDIRTNHTTAQHLAEEQRLNTPERDE